MKHSLQLLLWSNQEHCTRHQTHHSNNVELGEFSRAKDFRYRLRREQRSEASTIKQNNTPRPKKLRKRAILCSNDLFMFPFLPAYSPNSTVSPSHRKQKAPPVEPNSQVERKKGRSSKEVELLARSSSQTKAKSTLQLGLEKRRERKTSINEKEGKEAKRKETEYRASPLFVCKNGNVPSL